MLFEGSIAEIIRGYSKEVLISEMCVRCRFAPSCQDWAPFWFKEFVGCHVRYVAVTAKRVLGTQAGWLTESTAVLFCCIGRWRLNGKKAEVDGGGPRRKGMIVTTAIGVSCGVGGGITPRSDSHPEDGRTDASEQAGLADCCRALLCIGGRG